ncbi:MAG TPA: peroxiredoxin [Candidatus Elarobacter sp.]|jgi:peroxiredoxin (alkyl hydroperoxide reductase subunit C)|nr:peroxiredoxin [Candidatus Elarobacter sp.]
MMDERSLTTLPEGLPVPVDDGAAAHLTGMRLPHVTLPSTAGDRVDLASIPGLVVVFAYPRTGRPGEPSLVEDWDQIPGARGCTPHTSGFRDLHEEFRALGARVFGLSTQDTAYQREMVERVGVPFPVLSDERLELARALNLPTMVVAGQTLHKRIAWIARDGVIERAFYPVFPPNENAAEVLAALRG